MRYMMWAALMLASSGAWANMAAQAQRSHAAGIDVITDRTNVKDVVVIVGILPAGDAMADPANIAIPTLTGMMLDRGTQSLDKFAISAQLENVGAEITFSVATQSLEVRAKCLKRDLPLVLGLIASELRKPALLPEEFDKAKQQFIGALQGSLQNTESRAEEAFGRAVFPEDHPNRPHPVGDFLTAAKSATLDEVKAFHAKYYGPAHMTLVLVGDVPVAQAEAEIAKDFAGWSGGQDYLRPATPAVAHGPREVPVVLNDKPSVSVILGQATGLRYRDPGALALRVGTAILGRGFTGRLMGTVRDREGLTYNISAGLAEDTIADGSWDISASFAPELLNKGIAATRRELEKWWRDGVTETELAEHKQGIIGSYLVSLSTTAGVAGAIVAAVQRGYDLSWLDQYPEAVNALTRDEVNTAIKTHLDPKTMVLVEAGSLGAAGH
jgi:zinc protease